MALHRFESEELKVQFPGEPTRTETPNGYMVSGVDAQEETVLHVWVERSTVEDATARLKQSDTWFKLQVNEIFEYRQTVDEVEVQTRPFDGFPGRFMRARGLTRIPDEDPAATATGSAFGVEVARGDQVVTAIAVTDRNDNSAEVLLTTLQIRPLAPDAVLLHAPASAPAATPAPAPSTAVTPQPAASPASAAEPQPEHLTSKACEHCAHHHATLTLAQRFEAREEWVRDRAADPLAALATFRTNTETWERNKKAQVVEQGSKRWPQAPLTQAYCGVRAEEGEYGVCETKNAANDCPDFERSTPRVLRDCATCSAYQAITIEDPWALLAKVRNQVLANNVELDMSSIDLMGRAMPGRTEHTLEIFRAKEKELGEGFAKEVRVSVDARGWLHASPNWLPYCSARSTAERAGVVPFINPSANCSKHVPDPGRWRVMQLRHMRVTFPGAPAIEEKRGTWSATLTISTGAGSQRMTTYLVQEQWKGPAARSEIQRTRDIFVELRTQAGATLAGERELMLLRGQPGLELTFRKADLSFNVVQMFAVEGFFYAAVVTTHDFEGVAAPFLRTFTLR